MSGDRMMRLYFILRLLFLAAWFIGVTAAIVYLSHDGVAAFVEHVMGWKS